MAEEVSVSSQICHKISARTNICKDQGGQETEVDWCTATSSPTQAIIQLRITILTTSKTILLQA